MKVLKAMILCKLVLFTEGDLPCLSTGGVAVLPLCFKTLSILPAETCRIFFLIFCVLLFISHWCY